MPGGDGSTVVPVMVESAVGPSVGSPLRPWSFRPVRVERVVPETADAVTFVLDVSDHPSAFRYEAGQFVTLRVTLDGEALYRSYSMSSSPVVDDDLRITVKRVPGGRVSNWLIDDIRLGDVLDVSPPSGRFVLAGAGDVVAFAAGSGITPVFSILKTALRAADRRVRLLYANRDEDTAIFRDELHAIGARHADRFVVQHHRDIDHGFVTPDVVAAFVADAAEDAHHYVCGPAGFIGVVEGALRAGGVGDRVHVERFSSTDDEPPSPARATAPASELTITWNKRTVTVQHRPGTTILQAARAAGLRPPSSCETGSCATCMAAVVEGDVETGHNDVLMADEVADGWVLTCQAVPASAAVRVVYE
jgi:3-ketosteroid 9alpha-monooxygenase subunit B